MQVRVIVSGGRLVDVQAEQLPSDRSRSQAISSDAGPQLRNEALRAQSARINTVSGATYTSDGYAQSLQSALDRAGSCRAVRRVEELWGTAIGVEVVDDVEPEVVDALYRWFERVDELFSTWRDDSEISRIGRGELPLRDASPEVATVLALCDDVCRLSGGAFDITFGARATIDPRPGARTARSLGAREGLGGRTGRDDAAGRGRAQLLHQCRR